MKNAVTRHVFRSRAQILYAEMPKKPLIYGETPERERQAILYFRASRTLSDHLYQQGWRLTLICPKPTLLSASSHFDRVVKKLNVSVAFSSDPSPTPNRWQHRSSFNAFSHL
jgi:DNA excision repair protein ERCC-3